MDRLRLFLPGHRTERGSGRSPILQPHMVALALSLLFLALEQTHTQAASSSSSYLLLHQALSIAGGHAASLNYTADASVGGFGGIIQSQSGAVVAQVGYAAQINYPPVATNDTFHSQPGVPLVLAASDLLGNDFDPDRDPLTLLAVSRSPSSPGTVVLTATGALYQPPGNFIGEDLLFYTVSDGKDGITVGNISVVLAKSVPVVTWANPAGITYGTALGASQQNATAGVPGTFSYTLPPGTVLNAGDQQALSVAFTPTDTANYSSVSASVLINVTKALLTVTGDNKSKVFGTANPALTTSFSGFVNGDGASVVSGAASLSTTATTASGVGTYPITAAAGTLSAANYTFSLVNGTLTVTKASPTINWMTPGDIVYGTPLSSAQLNASADVPGTFAYSPAAGSVLNAGDSQQLTATFTPIDTASYTAASSSVRMNVIKADQTISFAALPGKVFGNDPFTLSATASSGLAVTFSIVSGPATLSGSTVTLTGTGTVTVRAAQAGNANYNAAANVDQPFTVAKASQTITFAALPDKVFGDAPFGFTATADSGLPLTFSVVSGPATMSGSTVTLTGVGPVVVRASQLGNANYEAAADVDRSFTVAKANQTISFGALPGKIFGNAPFAVTATASSGFAVSFSILSGPATLSGNTVTLTGAGAVTVRAEQAGNANYHAAANLDQSFTVAKAGQTITFAALADKVFGDAPVGLTATADSGLAVTFSIVSGPATMSGSTVTLTGAGTVVVRASQAGNANYEAAADVDRSFTVAKANQTISFAALPNKAFGSAPFALSATAASGLSLNFSIVSGPATLSGSTVTLTGIGTVTVRAAQAGNANYNAAANVDQPFSVAKGGQTITFAALADKVIGDAPFGLTATADSGLAVSFSIVSGPATMSGGTVTLTGAGTVVVRASQAGNANYEAAADVDRSFTVAKADQTITFAALLGKVFGNAPFAVSATASSGLAVGFSIVSGPAIVFGSTVTLTGIGTVIVRAAQAGNANYNAAANVDQPFAVSKGSQAITFAPLVDKVFGDAPLGLTATSDSGLTVTFSIVSGPATISGSTVTLAGAGTVVVRASQPGNANYEAAPDVDRSFTVAKASQTISFAALLGKVFGNAPFAVSATASSGLAVGFSIVSGPATASGSTVTLTGIGTVIVRAAQAGNANYNAAANVDQPFAVSKGSQAITFAPLVDKVFGDIPFGLTATANSGLAVTFSVVSGPATLSGNTVTFTGAGAVVVRASQAGNANYEAAPDVKQGFTVAKADQTISFAALPNRAFGSAPFVLGATASSGLAVSFSIVSGPATLSGSTVTLTGAGTVTVRAAQAGNANYNPAANVDQSFTVSKASQTITFTSPANKVFGDAPFGLTATADSGLTAAFSIVSGPATISGSTVTLIGAGTVVIRASQAGNANYEAAPDINRSFTVAKADQTISFAALPSKVYGNAPFAVSAAASSGLVVSFSILSGPATLTGSTVTLTGAGTVTVRAAQAGNANYNAAANVDQPFVVSKGSQTIAFAALADKIFGDAPFGLRATADSSLTVTFSIVSGPATLSGNTVTLTGAGTVLVRASQPGSGNYEAAADVDRSFAVAKANQTVSFAALPNKAFGSAPFALSATASSGLAVSFSIISGPATLSGSTVTLTGIGTVTVRAAQAGNANYNAAANVDQSFIVSKGGQTIAFAALADKIFGNAPFGLIATADSGLTVIFSIVSGPATISGSTVTLTGAGTVVVRASQPGNGNYEAAADVNQGFTVAKADQTLLLNGVALDGYIEGAIVFFDANRNGTLDNGEPQDVTDQAGRFTNLVLSLATFDTNRNGKIDSEEGRIVVTGGIDVATGFLRQTPLTAPAGFQIVSPVTTLITALMQGNTAADATSAANQVAAAFGLPSQINLAQYDPFQASGGPDAISVAKASSQINSLTKEISSLLTGTATNSTANQVGSSVIQALAAEIRTQPASVLRLDDTNVVTRLIFKAQEANGLDTNSAANTHTVTNAAAIIAQSNQAMEKVLSTGGTLTELASIQIAAEGKISNDLERVGKGTFDVVEALINNTGTNLDNTLRRPGTFTFSRLEYSVAEDGGAISPVTVIRTDGNYGAVNVVVKLADGSATLSGNDYRTNRILLTFENGEIQKVVDFSNVIINDTTPEDIEDLSLTLVPGDGFPAVAQIGEQKAARLQIIDYGTTGTRITFTRVGNEIRLDWVNPPSQLQEADSVGGPWRVIGSSLPPYTVGATTNVKFFRLQTDAIGVRVTASRVGSQIRLDWTNPPLKLQEATSINGPWTDIGSPLPPHTIPTTTPRKFFRLQR